MDKYRYIYTSSRSTSTCTVSAWQQIFSFLEHSSTGGLALEVHLDNANCFADLSFFKKRMDLLIECMNSY